MRGNEQTWNVPSCNSNLIAQLKSIHTLQLDIQNVTLRPEDFGVRQGAFGGRIGLELEIMRTEQSADGQI